MACWYVFAVMATLSFVSSCPENQSMIQAKLQECYPQNAGNAVVDPMKDAVGIADLCQSGQIHAIIDCWEQLLSDCRVQSPERMTSLDNLLSLENMRAGLDYICNNAAVIEANKKCLAGIGNGAVTQCALRHRDEMMRALSANPGDIWAAVCGYWVMILECHDDLVREQCGDEVADILDTFLRFLKPPVCESTAEEQTTIPRHVRHLVSAASHHFFPLRPTDMFLRLHK